MHQSLRLLLSFSAGVLCAMSAHANNPQTLCIFDVAGSSGDAYSLMKDFALESQKRGVALKLYVYKEEADAIFAFEQKQCQALMLTDIAARQYNKFVGSINAVGAVPNYRVARTLDFLRKYKTC